MLDKEYKYFLDNQEDFIKKYSNKYIVIKNQNVIGIYDSNAEAHSEASTTNEPGTFLVQHCKAYNM